MTKKTWTVQQMLELYIMQQRKHNTVIFTNDDKMKQLLEKAHPNITVKVIKLPQPIPSDKNPLGMLGIEDFDRPNPLIFKPYYRYYDNIER